MIFLTIDHICRINKEWIERYGGRYVAVDSNLRSRASLEYIIEAIQYPIFGYEQFPSLFDKAGALAWWIIEGHIFWDGNKRTGMQSLIELLELNWMTTIFDSDSTITIALSVADGSMSLKELIEIIPMYIMIQ